MTQIDINNAVDWSSIETVTLPNLSADDHKLLSVLEQELQTSGFEPVYSEDGTGDAALSLTLDQVPDLTETGATRQRVKAVRIQIIQQKNSTVLAQGRYLLASTQPPEQGVHRIFQKLRKEISQPQVAANAHQRDRNSDLPTEPATTEISTNKQPQQRESDNRSGHTEPTLKEDKTPSDWLPKFRGWQLSTGDKDIP